jgi:hypothetical protein
MPACPHCWQLQQPYCHELGAYACQQLVRGPDMRCCRLAQRIQAHDHCVGRGEHGLASHSCIARCATCRHGCVHSASSVKF